MMAEGDLAEALRRLMERGWRTGDPTRGDMAGLQDLLDRLERQREAMLERYQLDDVLGDIRRELERDRRRGARRRRASPRRGVERRRRRLDRGPAEDAARRRGAAARPARRAAGRRRRADPRPPGLRLPRAARARTVRRARQEAPGPGARPVRGRHVRGDPDDDARRTSPPTARWSATSTSSSASGSAARDPDASEFLAKHGQFFPGAQTFDDIIDQLAQRMAAMQSLMRSMSPEQRAELQSMMDALLRDDRLAGRSRPARVEPRPAAAGRARRPGPVRRRGAARASRARSRRSAGSRRWTGWRTRCPTSRRRPTWPRSIATRSATCSATTRCASSRPSTTSPAGSRRPAT